MLLSFRLLHGIAVPPAVHQEYFTFYSITIQLLESPTTMEETSLLVFESLEKLLCQYSLGTLISTYSIYAKCVHITKGQLSMPHSINNYNRPQLQAVAP